MNFPENLRYTKDHEWVSLDGDIATIGITDHAQHELGDIVFVDINTVGDTLNQHEVFGTIEAVKTVSDLFMPLDGEVMEMNSGIDADPANVNRDPYGEGWMVKVRASNLAQFDNLLTAAQYRAEIGA